MKKEIRSTLILIAILLLIGIIVYYSNNGVFSSSWTREYINGKEVIYKTPDRFKDCVTLNELASSGKELQKELSQERLSKIQYLDTLLRAYCVNYDNTPVSPDLTGDDRVNQKIITTAIELGIIKSDSETPFKANSQISKIEALALIFRLTNIEVKNDLSSYNFRDVEDNWKEDVAAKATHLGLVYTSTSKNSFYPNRIMNQGDAYKMLKQMAKYYR